MTTLHRIGYWIRSLDDDIFPPPHEFVSNDDASVRKIVADYLDAGTMVEAYCGAAWCRFLCGRRQNGSCELSDGYWIWPEGLSHYVRDHNVRLPQEFLSDVLAGGPLQAIPVEQRPEAPTDCSFWKEWSSRNRSGTLKGNRSRPGVAGASNWPSRN